MCKKKIKKIIIDIPSNVFSTACVCKVKVTRDEISCTEVKVDALRPPQKAELNNFPSFLEFYLFVSDLLRYQIS